MRQRVVGIQILALLVDSRDFEIDAEPDEAAVGRKLTRQHLQERGLARAIGADKADPVAARDAQAKTA